MLYFKRDLQKIVINCITVQYKEGPFLTTSTVHTPG